MLCISGLSQSNLIFTRLFLKKIRFNIHSWTAGFETTITSHLRFLINLVPYSIGKRAASYLKTFSSMRAWKPFSFYTGRNKFNKAKPSSKLPWFQCCRAKVRLESISSVSLSPRPLKSCGAYAVHLY